MLEDIEKLIISKRGFIYFSFPSTKHPGFLPFCPIIGFIPPLVNRSLPLTASGKPDILLT